MDEKKTYQIVGKVEIGTDEYRDLIEGLASARAEASENSSARWRESREKDKVQEKLDDVTKKYELYKEFINSSPIVKESWSNWYAEKVNKGEL